MIKDPYENDSLYRSSSDLEVSPSVRVDRRRITVCDSGWYTGGKLERLAQPGRGT
jgi:hypothetical protein